MTYIHELGPLFHDVQMAGVFNDGKTFPDCLPKHELPKIAEAYEVEKGKPGFNLSAFVAANFQLPPSVGGDYKTNPNDTPSAHIEALWEVLTRQPDGEAVPQSSLIPLPNPYVVPGGRFREVYYWDSYFTMLGLKAHGRWDLIEKMLDNFAFLINQFGFVPNGNRSYYLSRSQPPFLSLMVKLLAEKLGDYAYLKYGPALVKEYGFWMETAAEITTFTGADGRVVKLDKNDLLNRYWDDQATPRPESYREDVELSMVSMQTSAELFRNIRAAAESGWDFSSRWFSDRTGFESIRTTDIIPVDLNCLLWHLETTLVKLTEMAENQEAQEMIAKEVDARRLCIQRYFWDETDGFYFDFNFKEGKRSFHRTLAAVYPLFFKLSTQEQADSVAEIIKNDFLKPGGLATTLLETGQQWDAPNGWAPLQWMAYIGLKNYGHRDLADTIRQRWLETVKAVYQKTGKMTEKYNVFSHAAHAGGGEYENQDGFGWTNGVFMAMVEDMEVK